MFKAGLNKGFALVEVYRALFGLTDVEAHQAPDDTTMVLEIIRFIATYNGKSQLSCTDSTFPILRLWVRKSSGSLYRK
jgi:hypothetical protein